MGSLHSTTSNVAKCLGLSPTAPSSKRTSHGSTETRRIHFKEQRRPATALRKPDGSHVCIRRRGVVVLSDPIPSPCFRASVARASGAKPPQRAGDGCEDRDLAQDRDDVV